MVVYNYSGKEINAKIVYYGPALSGKTTNLEWIYSKIPLEYSGKMISLRTQTDRTIFFDFLPLELGLIDGFKTRFMLYTVPGQVYYNATRKMVLKGVDGVVFVADSEQGRMQDNRDSLQNLRENLEEIGLDLETLPLVMQWNKRDLPNCDPVEEMEGQLNPRAVPSFEASALTGEGVYETLHRISKMIYRRLTTGEEGATQSRPPEREEETSLFGADIAARLQQLDAPPEVHEPVAVAPRAGAHEPAQSDGAVLDAILGAVRPGTAGAASPLRASASPSGPLGPVPAAAVPAGPRSAAPAAGPGLRGPVHSPPSGPRATVQGAAAGPRSSPPSAPSGPRPAAAPPSQRPPAAPALHTGTPRRPAATPQAEGPEQKLVSDLVDNVLSPMDGQRPRETSAPPTVEGAQTGPAHGDDPLTYGSSYGRMVSLDGKDVAGAADAATARPAAAPPPVRPQGAPTAPVAPAAAAAPAMAAGVAGSQPPPPEVHLELITDPRKLSSDAAASKAAAERASETSQFGFASRLANAKIIEVPITLDADALADGKTIRIVLNLKVAH
jgi:signal recognition particle receptor subunit beta